MNNHSLASARSVALVLPKTLTDGCVGAALSLCLFFIKNNTAVTVCSETAVPHSWKRLDTRPLSEHAAPLVSDCVITVRADGAPVDEIRYEKTPDGNVNIIVSPKNAPIDPKCVTVSEAPRGYDCVITIGAKNISSIGSLWKKHPELFYEKPIIAIDADDANGTRRAIAEKTAELMESISEHPFAPETATPLLFSLLAETGDQPDTRYSGARALAKKLEVAGADRSAASPRESASDLSSFQLMGRAWARSKFEPAIKTLWSVLTADDFTVTRTTPSSLPSVLRAMKTDLPDSDVSVVLWQDPERRTVSSVVDAKRPDIVSRIRAGKEYASFIEAEEHIRRLLREAL